MTIIVIIFLLVMAILLFLFLLFLLLLLLLLIIVILIRTVVVRSLASGAQPGLSEASRSPGEAEPAAAWASMIITIIPTMFSKCSSNNNKNSNRY